jgi:AAA+ ATPase superfamily predicted ATPase
MMTFGYPSITVVYGLPGSGKTNVIKHIANNLNIDNKFKLYVITLSPDIFEGLKFKKIFKDDDIDIKKIDKFRNLKGYKLLIFDDILGLVNNKISENLYSILARNRKYNMYVILGTQSLTFISPAFLKMCHNAISFNMDEDAIKLLISKSGRPKKEVLEYIYSNPLEIYEFYYTTSTMRGIKKNQLPLV